MEGHGAREFAYGHADHCALCGLRWALCVALPHPGARRQRDDAALPSDSSKVKRRQKRNRFCLSHLQIKFLLPGAWRTFSMSKRYPLFGRPLVTILLLSKLTEWLPPTP